MKMLRKEASKKNNSKPTSVPHCATEAGCRHLGAAHRAAGSPGPMPPLLWWWCWWCWWCACIAACIGSRQSIAQTAWPAPAPPACQRFRYVRRPEWGWAAPSPQAQVAGEPFRRAPSRLFVHQAWDGRTCADLDSCSVRLRAIQAYHRHSKNWPDIGYNFLISGDGTVYEGLGYNTTGYHTLNFNGHSLGVALIGTFHDQAPSRQMLESVAALAGCAAQRGHLSPSYTIHGHRDATCTICPGEAAYTQLARLERFQRGPLRGYTCPRRPLAAAGSDGRPLEFY